MNAFQIFLLIGCLIVLCFVVNSATRIFGSKSSTESNREINRGLKSDSF
jgi:hypothetical protein